MNLNQFENEFKLNTETMEYYCTIGLYSLLAFQRHEVRKFWVYGLKDMNFARFKQLNSNVNLIELSRATWQPLIGPYRFGRIRL
jgi:hypothetical protein